MLQLVANGLAIGAIYALTALGFVLIHNATGAVNFAHGELVMVGGYVSVFVAIAMGLHPAVAIIAVPVVMALIGVVLQFVAFKPLQGKPFVSVFISTIAIGIILTETVLLVAGPYPRDHPPLLADLVQFGGITVTRQAIAIFVVTVVLVGIQRWLFAKTLLGQQLRATAQDPEAAQLIGIPVGRMIVITFALAAAFAGVAGSLLAPVFNVQPTLGISLILKTYIAVVIGGFGSLGGAVIGGLGLGVLEILTAGYITSAFRDAVIYAVLLAFLVLRPEGIFGEVVAEKV